MTDWDPQCYLQFCAERMLACRDLAARIGALIPPGLVRRVVDLGSGPGTSTAVLAGLWPDAEFTGVDSSPAMIAAATGVLPEVKFVRAEIRSWAETEAARYDVVFSNAALHWVPRHAELFPLLLARVAPGGLLAFQMPALWGAACQLPRQLIGREPWRRWVSDGRTGGWHSHELGFYYDLLAGRARRLELWETDYLQVFDSADQIVEWYQGSGLRPYLDALPGEPERQSFLQAYREGLRAAYPPRDNGKVLFPVRRRFAIAQASD